MSIDTIHVCMYTPSSAGGHALYTQELLTALAEVGPGRGIAPELVTSEDLAAAHRTSAYPIHPILPRLTPRCEYRTAPGVGLVAHDPLHATSSRLSSTGWPAERTSTSSTSRSPHTG